MSTSSAIGGTTSGTTSQTPTLNNAQLSLKPTDFLNMMVTELQNQDPFKPADNNALLGQMSQIGTLQASTDLQSSLKGLVLQNQVGAASSLIGKMVQGTDSNKKALSGVVTSVNVNQNSVSLQLDSGQSLDLGSVTNIASATGAATPTAAN